MICRACVTAYSQAHSLVWVQRCEEHDGFDRRAKHTAVSEFYLRCNPAYYEGVQTELQHLALAWDHYHQAVSNTAATFHHPLSVHQVKSGLGAGEDASR